MKIKLQILILVFTFSNYCLAQNTKVHLVKDYDKMTKKTLISVSKPLKLLNASKTKGFIMNQTMLNDSTTSLLLIELFNLGKCREDDELIILFENDETLTEKSFGKFSCNNYSAFILKGEDLLKQYPIKSIRFTNGYNGLNYTADLTKTDKTYFIELYKAIEDRIIMERTKK